MNNVGRWSIRSQSSRVLSREAYKTKSAAIFSVADHLGLPHEMGIAPQFIDLENNLARKACLLLIEYKFTPLVFPSVDYHNALWAGAAQKQCDRIVIEVNRQPVTARKLTRDGVVGERYEFTNRGKLLKSTTSTSPDLTIIALLNKLIADIPIDFTVEISMYKKPVGILHEELLFWDGYRTGEEMEEWQ